MAFVMLLLIVGGFAALGYWRGGLRLGLVLAPLMLASLLLWLFGPSFYHAGWLTESGLIWPALILAIVGLAAGYALQFWGRRKLPKQAHRADRVAGSIVGGMLGVLVVWVGCLYVMVWSATHQREARSSAAVARALNAGVVRWIPGVGAGSDAMMGLTEIAMVDESVRERAARELGVDHLAQDPYVQAVVNDPATYADLEAAAAGNLAALWRLQKNPLVLEMARSPSVSEAVGRLSLEDVREAVRKARAESEAAAP